MNDKTKFIITCRFPPWGYEEIPEFPAFGVKYLIEVPNDILMNSQYPDKSVEVFFKSAYKEKIQNGKKGFDGEILFVEETNLVVL